MCPEGRGRAGRELEWSGLGCRAAFELYHLYSVWEKGQQGNMGGASGPSARNQKDFHLQGYCFLQPVSLVSSCVSQLGSGGRPGQCLLVEKWLVPASLLPFCSAFLSFQLPFSPSCQRWPLKKWSACCVVWIPCCEVERTQGLPSEALMGHQEPLHIDSLLWFRAGRSPCQVPCGRNSGKRGHSDPNQRMEWSPGTHGSAALPYFR